MCGLSRENKEVEVLLTYDKGLDRYYGLIDLAIEANILKKSGNRIELPGGAKQYAKTIYEKPEKYFTSDLMEKIEEYAAAEFTYGGIPIEEEVETEIEEEDV